MSSATASFDSPGSLIEATRKLIQRDKRTIPELYKETGLPFHWLRKFAAGEITNPSVNRVQFLYEKMTGKKLL